MLRTFETNEEIYKIFKSICDREGEKVTKKIASMIEDYVKVHKDGNPQHTIDAFTTNEDFYGFPSIAINKQKKSEWINSDRIKDKDLTELYWHVQEYKTELEKKGFRF